MIKLIVCILSLFALGMLTLQLRQERLDLNHQCIDLHNQIEGQQAKLWNQQLDVALWTAPNTIAKTVSNHGLKMIPQTPQMPGTASWIQSEKGSEE